MTFSITSTAIGVIQAIAKPDLVTGRTIVQETYHAANSDDTATIYTVTPGKTFYVTTMSVQGLAAANYVVLYVGDAIAAVPGAGATAADTIPIIIDNDSNTGQIITFASPMAFTTSVKIKSSGDWAVLSVGIVGWEE